MAHFRTALKSCGHNFNLACRFSTVGSRVVRGVAVLPRIVPRKLEGCDSKLQISTRNFSHDSTAHTPPATELLSELTPSEYEDLAEETLDSLTEKFEDLYDTLLAHPEFDVQLSGGVLTINLGTEVGTYVINKQTPNRQIWLSSPLSGPKRYDFIDGCWKYRRDGVCMHDLLSSEITEALGVDTDFTGCSHGAVDDTVAAKT